MKRNKFVITILILTIAFLPVIASSAFASRCFQQQRFQSFQQVHFRHQPIQQFSNISYFVGAPIRIESLVQQEVQRIQSLQQQTQSLQQQQYEEFLQFQAWKAQKQPIQTQMVPEVQKTLVQSFCSKCHTGSTPKGEFSINGVFTAIERDKAARKVILGEMPKGQELTPAEKGSLVKEILLLGVED